MGQCYSVNVKIDAIDETGLAEAVREFMTENDWSEDRLPAPDATPEEVFESFLNDLHDNGGDGEYYTDFDAQYGYHDTMLNIYDRIAPYLADGCYLVIYPDEGYTKTIVENGVAVDVS